MVEQVKYLRANVPQVKELYVVLLNDIHYGSNALDWGLHKRVFDFIDRNKENTRILINGDLFHNITKNSKGSLYEQRISPQEQFDMAIEYFKPYADLIEGVTVGNHDWRTEDETSIDLMLMFCRMLGIEDKYLQYRGVVGFSLNKNHYTVEMYHGTGGGSTLAAVERNMKKMRRTTADVFYCGHWHKEFVKPFKEYQIDPYNKKVHEYKKFYVCGNTMVQLEKYAEKFSYDESYPSQAVLKLSGIPKKRNIEVEWIR